MKFKRPVRCKRCREVLDPEDVDIGEGYCQDCLPYKIEKESESEE